ALRNTWETGLRELMRGAEPSSDHQLTFTRSLAAAARSEKACADLEALLDGSLELEGLAVDQDLRWVLLTGLAAAGCVDEDRITEELARDNTISGQEHAGAARAAQPTWEAKAAAWDAAVLRADPPNETQRSIALAFQRTGQDEVLEPYVEKYLEAAETVWEHLGTHRASVALSYLFPRPLASEALLERVDAWLASSTANPAAKRFVLEGRADVARYLAGQSKDA
ncbi:MAG: ERAP1-like C-terminal domain-containing protein, partial [Actinomycetota bacterium]|nr:ERAP1-like C-terminal domain-containing protein [Actinomycetota bacterium]